MVDAISFTTILALLTLVNCYVFKPLVRWNNSVNDFKLKTLYLRVPAPFKRLFQNSFPNLLTGIIKFWIYSAPFCNCIWSMFVLINDVPIVAFACCL